MAADRAPAPTKRSSRLTRALDRFVGIPLVALLAARRLRRRTPPASLRRVGIVKTNAIGDTVLVSAIARDLAAHGAEVVLFCGRTNAGIARQVEGVTSVVSLPLRHPLRAARALRAHDLDLLLDCGAWPRINAVLSALAGARFTIGFRTPGQGRHFAYDRVVDHSNELHELENYRRLLAAAGVPAGSAPGLRVKAGLAEERRPAEPFVVCHLWAGGYQGRLREWAPERWRAVISALVAEGYQVVLTGAPSNAADTRAFHAGCAALGDRVVNAAGIYSFDELTDLLRRSALVISVNTGIMHMAAAVGTPTLALNGPTAEHRWGPVGPRVRSVNSSLPGCGFLNLGHEYAGRRIDCMEGIAVEDVLAGARALLSEGAAAR